MKYLLILFLLLPSLCFGATIQTARGPLEVKNGDTLQCNSMWVGTIDGLDKVTFVGWNFSRDIPHTEVFTHCTNLTFIDCNLNNVELQDDFTTQGSLTMHQREYESLGKTYKEVECGDNKIRLYELISEDIDIIERDFGNLTKADKDKIKAELYRDEMGYIEHREEQILISTEDTPSEKIIKGIRIHPNTVVSR